MSKWVTVVFAYKPKNDDELELKVGDEIEVLEFVEDGWLSGKLRTGEVGVFPSNFVVDATSPTVNPNQPPPVTNNVSNKLSLFSSKSSKTSLSSNSLNSNSSNNLANIMNSNNNNNNNLMMNNTQHQESIDLANTDDPSVASSERRPKPIRGVGYGDIFASGRKPKPLPDLASNLVSEKLSLNINPLQKQRIPSKPPPPAPTTDNSNGTSTDQAPALPPKPANQFSPLMQHNKPLPPTQQHQTVQQVREQARVVYAYEPTNDDELAIGVGDIIDIIDKDIEDAGWWRGELRGKIGVFPDNFVQLIEAPTTANLDRQPTRAPANINLPTVPGSIQQNNDKIKSVFATTPKGFSKELENNLEKHNNPASFLSLKRNKLQQHSTGDSTMSLDHERREDVVGPLETGTMKLNHITASRAKGPSRRPPSNILNKRNHLDQVRREFNGKEESTLGSLPVNSSSQPANHDSLSSLPTGQNTTLNSGTAQTTKQTEVSSNISSIKQSSSPNVPLDNQALVAPKTSQRVTQPVSAPEKEKPTTTPAWMVELKKTTAEKKRDPQVVATPPSSSQDEELSPGTNPISAAQYDKLLQISKNVTSEITELREDFKRLREETRGVSDLRDMLEAMKIDLKACQSATENQRRYIKDLVNNLADERKKIAAMQDEIDRNLK